MNDHCTRQASTAYQLCFLLVDLSHSPCLPLKTHSLSLPLGASQRKNEKNKTSFHVNQHGMFEMLRPLFISAENLLSRLCFHARDERELDAFDCWIQVFIPNYNRPESFIPSPVQSADILRGPLG